jgi:hypothetical protein
MDPDFENTMRKCNCMSAIRRAATDSESVNKASQPRDVSVTVEGEAAVEGVVTVQVEVTVEVEADEVEVFISGAEVVANVEVSVEADTEVETNIAEAEVAEINAPSGEHPDPASLIPRNLAIDLVSDFENEELVGPTSRQPTIANPLPSSEDIESSNQAPMSSCAAIPVYTKGNFEKV